MMARIDRRVRELIRQRKAHGYGVDETARIAGCSDRNWRYVETGQVFPGLPILDAVAELFGGSVEIVQGHHRPFLELDPAEAYVLLDMARQIRERRSDLPEVVATLTSKLDKWTRSESRAVRTRD